MTLIFCLDNHNGIMFNGRRQSSDKAVIERVMNCVNGHRLWIDAYSRNLLPAGRVFDGQNQHNDVIFAETTELIDQCMDMVNKLIVYRWNRAYPADAVVPMERITENWRLESRKEFSGNSHDLITEEVYVRE